MPVPGPGYSITVRLQAPPSASAAGELTSAVGRVGGVITAFDVVESSGTAIIVDITCNADSEEHAQRVTDALGALPGVTVRKVSDRTFLVHLGGKLDVNSKVPLRNRDDLSRAYTPGVARVCQAIAANPEDARRLTIKRNSVAVVTDGSAVLGLGNLGPAAAMPVMEGKTALFKEFADIDGWPLCLGTQNTDEIVRVVQAIAPSFGGINLEDISAPRCFEIEDRLKATLDIPVMHDDQHGTAVVLLAALLNAIKVCGKDIARIKVVVNGLGAAGTACCKILLSAGVRHLIGCDRKGAVLNASGDELEAARRDLRGRIRFDEPFASLHEALAGADVFIGVSAANLLSVTDLETMAGDRIVFAMANP